MAQKPKSENSLSQQELDKAEAQFDAFDANVKQMTLDRMNEAPKQEVEAQTKLSAKDIAKSNDIYLKPIKSLGVGQKEKFNEKFRKDHEFATEYVQFVAENKEIIGDDIEIWTKPFPGMNCEYWRVPTNKPVWGPRHLAEQITRAKYHRFVMQNTVTEANYAGQMYGSMAADTTIQRLDAHPVKERKSVFMGASGF